MSLNPCTSLTLRNMWIRKSYADDMSRPDAKQWKEAFDKEMDGLVKREVFTVVDRLTDQNPLGTTMVWKYKIVNVNRTVTRRLCLRGDWQKEGVDFFKHKTFSAVLNYRENRLLYALAAANNWHMFTSEALTSLRPSPMVNWTSLILLSTSWIQLSGWKGA